MKTVFVTILLLANYSFADVYLLPGENQNVGGTQVFCAEQPTVSYTCKCDLICTGGAQSFHDFITLDKMTAQTPSYQVELEATRTCERKFVSKCDYGLYNTYITNCKKTESL
jgi:hypothetical protein